MLLDTSGLLSYHSADEATHQAAKRLFKARRRQLTHGYVLAEFLALVNARKLPRLPARRDGRVAEQQPLRLPASAGYGR
jgi:predicted nucleic acid-binding protein